jgi:transposase
MVKKYIVSLTAEEQGELKDIISRCNAKAQAVKRAYVLLAADENAENLVDSEIALRYKVTVRCIEGMRKRFVEEGFEQVVYGKKRTLFKEKIFDGRVEAHLIALRCSDPPKGHSAWTLHLLADHLIRLGYVEHISHESVRQLLKKKRTKALAGERVGDSRGLS